MARVEPDALADPEQVYIAASMRAARKVEALLTGLGINYATQVEVLGRSSLFGSLRHGAAFYVDAGQADYTRSALDAGGLSQGLVLPDEASEELSGD